MNRRIIKILLSVIVIVGAAGYLVVDTLFATDALTYFHSADEVLANPGQFADRRIRVGGHVRKGSIAQKPGTLEYVFDVEPVPEMLKHPEVKDETLRVFYEGVVPDTFKDDAEVIVTGQLGSDGTFQAQELIAKCPSKYEAADKSAGRY